MKITNVVTIVHGPHRPPTCTSPLLALTFRSCFRNGRTNQAQEFQRSGGCHALKQTIADEPYKQEHGKVMEQWEKLADALVASPDFSHKISPLKRLKIASMRISVMLPLNLRVMLLSFCDAFVELAAANKKNTAAKRLSGVTESHSEKDQLLDELNLAHG
ncbi:hypothetical protein GQ600_12861 [Phytophthora cactorum]|nr:hypothetical protein GQ600_12861 [Phytophthora cactorum]